MGQGIQDFYYQVQRQGLHRDYMLRVAQIGGTVLNDQDLVLIKTATLPQLTRVSHSVPFMGVQFNAPGSVIYEGSDNWSIKVHATTTFNIRNEFEKLLNEGFDIQGRSPIGIGGRGDLSIPGPEKVIQLDLVNDKLQIIRTYYLVGIFVRKLGEINYDIQGTGAPLEFDVLFAYQYWSRNPYSKNPGIFGTIQDVAKGVGDIAGAVGGAAGSIGGIFN